MSGTIFKWVELSDRPCLPHYEPLSQYLTSIGVANEFQSITCSIADFPAKLEELKGQVDQIRLGGDLQTEIFKHITQWPSEMQTTGFADCYVKEKGGWWPRCFFSESLQDVLAHDFKELDFNCGVFIIGATPEARATIAALVRIGYGKFSITDANISLALSMVESLKRSYFKVDFEVVEKHLVTQMAGSNAIAVNTLSLAENPGLLQELYYFNFLKPNGVWLDLNLLPLESPLSEEVLSIGAHVILPSRVFAAWDTHWFKHCTSQKLDINAYTTFLQEKLRTYPAPELPALQDASEMGFDEG